jgi:hypothetical protein
MIRISPVRSFTMPSTFTARLTNGHARARTSTAHTLAVRLRDRAAELAGFLDGADLPAELHLDVAANLAAAEGMVVRATKAIEAAGRVSTSTSTRETSACWWSCWRANRG